MLDLSGALQVDADSVVVEQLLPANDGASSLALVALLPAAGVSVSVDELKVSVDDGPVLQHPAAVVSHAHLRRTQGRCHPASHAAARPCSPAWLGCHKCACVLRCALGPREKQASGLADSISRRASGY